MRNHGIYNLLGTDSHKRGSARRLRQAIAIAALAAFSVGCAVGSRVALPPLPVVALFNLIAATLPPGSTGASYGPATVSTNLSTSGTGTVSACQFVSPAGATPGSNTVPFGLQIAVGTPAAGAANTGCTISGVIGDTNGNGVIDAGEGVAPGTYTFTVRAADSSSPPQSDTQTYTIIVSSLQITLTAPATSVTGQSITITWTFSVTGSAATPNQAALVELLGPTSLVEDSCTGALTAGTCGALVSTTAGAHTIRLTYPAPPATDPNFPGTTVTSIAHTINVAPTTTTVVSAPDPTVTGEVYAANITVATNAPGGGAPTGTVAVSDGLGNTCNAALTPGVNQSTGTCNLNAPTAGARTLTASYPGDANYAASMGTDPHTVNPAATTTAITADTPDPSVTGESYAVSWTVTVNAPGAGTPTGTVTVDDGTGAMCSAAVGAGTCTITSVTAGAKVLTANYSGDADFNASAGTANHTVNPASTTTTITSDTPDPSITGETYTVNATVDTTAPGTGQPTGTVTVDDGQGQSCMITLAAGPGLNQSSGSCMLTSLTTAVTQLNANYGGDANYAASLGTAPHTVTLAPTSTTINLITPSPSTVGQATNVDVTVAPNPPGTGAPTGSVMVDDGFGGTCTIAALTPGVNQSTGSCMLTSTSTSVASLTATYSGDTNFAGSVGSLAHTVTASATTTALVSSVNPSVSGETITYTATVAPVPPGMGTPTGTVQFRVNGLNAGAPVALVGAVASFMTSFNASVSPQNVDAVYSGDVNFGGSTSNLISQVINPANTTTTITADTPDPTVTGESYTVNWTVAVNAPGAGAPTGTVTVDDGAGGMCSNAVAAGSCLLVSPTAGGKMLIATYSGDADFNGSASAGAAHTVNLASTTTTLMSSINPTVSGETSIFTATVAPVAPGAGAPTGSVQFRVNTVNVGGPVALVGGVASAGLSFLASVSPEDVDAVYSGDANFATSTSNTVTQVINTANTTTTLVSSNNPSVSGETVTFTATVAPVAPGAGAPTGTVQFSINSVPVGGPVALVGGVASFMQSFVVSAGENVDAVYSGDADFTGSASNTVTQVVNQANTTTALVSSANPSVSGETVTFTATVTANAPGTGIPTGNVVFRINTVAVFLAPLDAAGMATFPTAFTVATSPEDVDAVYTGDPEFVASISNNISQVTNQASTTTTVAGPGAATVTGEPYLVTFNVTANPPGAGAPTGTVTVDDGTDSCSNPAGVGGCFMVSTTNGGAKTLTATYSGDLELAGSIGTAAHTVNQATTTTAITMDAPDPTLAGEMFTVNWTVAINPPGAEVPPTVLGGTVTVRDTVNTADSCTAPVGAGGLGSCMLALSMTGARNLEAIYSGDANFSGSTSAVEPHTVNLASTTTTLVSSANPSVSGETVTFTATVAPVPPAGGTPAGTVQFQINSVPVGAPVALVGGVASFMQSFVVSAGENVDAVYSGDANFNGSASNVVTQVINQAGSTTTLVSSANPSVSGETVTFTATVAPVAPGAGTPTGTVQFQVNSVPAGAPVALVGGVASFMQSFTVAQSGALVDAIYSGDTEFTGSNSNIVTQTVNPATTSTLVVANGNADTSSGDTYTVNVTVVSNAPGSGEPDGDVDVDDGEGNTCNAVLVPGLPGTNTSSGSCMITSMTNGVVAKTITGNYNPGLSGEFAGSSGTDAHNVNRATTTTTINDKQVGAVTQNTTVSGEDFEVLVTVTTTAGQGEATGNVLVQDDNVAPTDSCTAILVPGLPGSNTSTGVCTMLNSRSAGMAAKNLVADYQGDTGLNDDFAISTSAAFPHVVNKAATGMSGGADIVKSVDPTVVGETYTVTVTVNASTGEGEPTGTVDVDDGFGGMCTLTLTPNVGLNNSTGSCMLASATTASTMLNATYAGDNDFNGVMASNTHTVNQASTTISITSVNPAGGTLSNSAYTINFSLAVNAPGAGSPTGTITVSDGTDNNACALPTTSCTLTSTTSGAKNLTATYSGDADFSGSVSPNFPYAIVAMFISPTPAAPGNVMGNGTEDVPIGGGSGPDLVLGNADDGDGVLFQFLFDPLGTTGPFTCSLASLPGTLPAGVTVQAGPVLTSGGADACALTGTPALGSAGMYVFDVIVQDSGVASATTGNITWLINGPLVNTSAGNLGDAVDQRNYTVTLSATGGQAPQLFSDNFGTLAADVDCVDAVGGLQFAFVLALNGDLTATPARLSDEAGADGVCNFTSQALNSPTSSTGLGPTGSGTEFVAHTITTQPALSFVTTAIPNAKKDLEYFPVSLGGQPGAVVQTDGGTGTHFFDVTVGPFTLQAGNIWTGDAGTACEGFSFPRDAAMILSPNALDTVVTGTSPRPTAFNTFSDTCTFTVATNDTGSGPTGPDPAPPSQTFNITIFNAMAFAAGFGTETLEVINTETNQLVTSIALAIPGTGQPNQVAVSPDGGFVFTSSVSTDHIAVVDASTGAPVTNSPFDVSASCNGPLGLATTLTAAGVRRVFAGCSVNAGGAPDERVVTYDFNPAAGGSLTPVATADFTGAGGEDHDPQGLALTPDGTTVFVVFRGTTAAGEWGRVDAATGAIIQNGGNDFTAFSPTCGSPGGVAIAQTAFAGNPVELYVACEGPDQIAIVDTTTLAQAAANISVGANPNSIAFIPGANAARAYATLNGADQVAVIDTAARTATNLNLPSPDAALDVDSDPVGITIPEVPLAGTLRIYSCLSGAAAPSPGVNFIDDPATAASVGTTIGTTASSSPRGIRHIPVPRR